MRRNRAGFSLVEVCLAIGIVVFVLTALMGLLSIGLSTGSDSAADTRLAAMAESVMAQEQSMPISKFTNPPQPWNYYFDFQGDPLPTATGAYYQCSVSVPNRVSWTPSSVGSVLYYVTDQFTFPCAAPASVRKSVSFYLQRPYD